MVAEWKIRIEVRWQELIQDDLKPYLNQATSHLTAYQKVSFLLIRKQQLVSWSCIRDTNIATFKCDAPGETPGTALQLQLQYERYFICVEALMRDYEDMKCYLEG